MQALAARVEALEAQEAIRQLWADYGRTLDARDFAAFSTLWAREATYGGTPAAPGAKGPAAIGAFLEKAIGTNYPDSKGKNFHLYFNESIDVQGDRATAVSKGGFVMASADNSKADFLLLATYRDELDQGGRQVEVPPPRDRRRHPGAARAPLTAAQRAEGGRVTWSVTPLPHAGGGDFPCPPPFSRSHAASLDRPSQVASPRRRLMGCRKRRSPRLRPPCRRRGRSLIAGRCWPT